MMRWKLRSPFYRAPAPDPTLRVKHMELSSRTAHVKLAMFVYGPITPYAHAPIASMVEKAVYELAAEDVYAEVG